MIAYSIVPLLDTQFVKDESVIEGGFLPAFISAGRSEVAATHLRFQQQNALVFL